MDQPPHSRLFGTSLGFLAGYVDTLGFIALFGLFTAHVTGNFVLIGAALADASRASILLKFLAFPAFIAGVAVTRLMVLAVERRAGPSLTLAMLLQWALLAGFMVFGCLAEPIGKDVSSMAMVAGLLGTAAMGVHSATSRLLLAHLAPTSMMTGNVTQIVIDTVDVLRGAADGATHARCGKFFWPLLAFALGAIAAAFAYLAFGFVALAVPLILLGALIVVQQRSGRPAVPAA
ncbi:YoaK family protein [Janthinobacterium sp. SUN137]|uniref:YoaK family protein n=1 Tax=Janthinobacterium sp. SUN137 TaxID=3014789 RepID=UPI002713ABBF|nr:YoaK family protein [Janthinobacterium sp. SUN137]MDO8038315.1 YoaK family protein [Janthinobacterium sp. SUN137]